MYITGGLSILLCLAWLIYFAHALRQLFAVEYVEQQDPPDPASWPRLTIIIPARNEEETIKPALQTLLEQNYPNLEIIAINDRSTDATGAILEEISQNESRLNVLHIDELPDGWLGKTHALHRGVQVATGDWLLFTDADVHYRPGALRRCLATALDRNLDHLACLPHMTSGGFWHEVVMASFLTFVIGGANIRRIHDPSTRDFVGVGGFNLVRRQAFEQTEGFEWIRLDTVDDIALGYMLQRYMLRSHFMFALKDLEVRWYDSLREMARGTEKNGFAMICQYRWKRLIGVWAVFLVMYFAPVAAWQLGGEMAGWSAGIVFAAGIAFSLLAGWRLQRHTGAALLLLVGMWFMPIVLTRAAVRFSRTGEVEWRDTKYSLDKLRKHQRAKVLED